MKVCTKCNTEYPATQEYFYRCGAMYCGLQAQCKQCMRVHQKAYYQANKTRLREYGKKWSKENKDAHYKANRSCNFYRKYGMSLEDYDNMFYRQNGRCAICNKHQLELKRRLNVDHNHATGKVRGLLCFNCNTILGKAYEDTMILQSALMYLRRK